MKQPPKPASSSGIWIALGSVLVLGFWAITIPSFLSQSSKQSKTEQAKKIEPKKVAENAVPAGWNDTGTPGIFYRYCEKKHNCPKPNNSLAETYWQMEVWCRDEPCDLYVQGSFKDADGRVIGWTNDTGKGMTGDKVILTFSSFDENAKTLQITDFRSS